MKIVKHTARDMRQALRLVREQLGPDAVILASKRIKGGVEVTAAIDFDAEQFEAHPAAPGEVRPFQPQEFEPPAGGDTERWSRTRTPLRMSSGLRFRGFVPLWRRSRWRPPSVR